MMTQNEMILNHLRENRSITPLEALHKYGCMRLGARVYDLKRMGFKIRKTVEVRKNAAGQEKHYARYWMVNDDADKR